MTMTAIQLKSKRSVLELTVKNHPGVMSHVCGLFARRLYNLEGILCMPISDDRHSRIWLLVNEDEKLDQIIKQTSKLVDVLSIKRHSADHGVFKQLEAFYTL